MNQTQANRLVELIEYFEGLPEDMVDLNEVGITRYKGVGGFEFKGGKVTLEVKECGSTYCLAGHLPYAFPNLYSGEKKVYFDDGRVRVEYDYPACKGIGEDPDGPGYVLKSFEKNFGISAENETLVDMFECGGKTGYYAYSDRGAVLQFLKDQLSKHGYEIVEVSA